MKRRSLLKNIGLVTAASYLAPVTAGAKTNDKESRPKKKLRIAHITDVHIRPELDAPIRFRKCLNDIKAHKVDFFLNSGDTIYAADYDDIKRSRVVEQWSIWKDLRSEFSEYEVHSCLGNHDMWWAAPNKQDPMYGKEYAVKQLGTIGRYYSFDKSNWHFIILDSNNTPPGSLDKEQRQWLETDLAEQAFGSNIIVMSHFPVVDINGGTHKDRDYITDLFYKHKDKKIHCLSGHVHLLANASYNNVYYYCNGAMSGFWWEEGNEKSEGKSWCRQTPPGYAILDLYSDGTIKNTYYPHEY